MKHIHHMNQMRHIGGMNGVERQRGVSLIEVLLSLSVIAIVVVGAVALFSSSSNSTKAQDLTRGLTTITSAIHSIYGQSPDYSTLLDSNAIALSGALPNNMVSGTGATAKVVTAFGDMTIAVNGSNSRQVDITYNSGTIPNDVCAKFVPNALGTVRAISIGGTVVATPADVITNCATDADGKGNTGAIVFTVD